MKAKMTAAESAWVEQIDLDLLYAQIAKILHRR